MVVKRVIITVVPNTLDEFYRLAGKRSIKFSTWVQVKMEEFIEEEEMIEKYRQQKKRSD